MRTPVRTFTIQTETATQPFGEVKDSLMQSPIAVRKRGKVDYKTKAGEATRLHVDGIRPKVFSKVKIGIVSKN